MAGRACHEIPSPPVAVNVEGRFADPILREDQSRAEISDKFGRPNVTLMGKTEIQKETEYNVQIRYFDSELSGGVCFSITMIDVVIAADPVTVYVANEHPRGTCEHRVTLEHENKHVEIERTALSRHSKRMRQQFASEDFVGTRFAYSSKTQCTGQRHDREDRPPGDGRPAGRNLQAAQQTGHPGELPPRVPEMRQGLIGLRFIL